MDASSAGHYCMECRWLDLRIDFDLGSNYWCLKKERVLKGAISQRPACADYASPPSGEYWGP